MTTQGNETNKEVSQPDKALSRRAFLRAVGGSAGAALLAACGVTTTTPTGGGASTEATAPAGGAAATTAPAIAPAAGATTLEFWAFSEERLGSIREVSKSSAWTSAHPDVAINFRVFPFREMHDKLLAALTSGQGAPDIADVEIGRFAQYIKGERVGFVPLNDRIASEKANIYTAAATDPWTWKDQIYGVGNELNTVVMAYRKDILDAAGVKTPFATWDEVVAGGKLVVAGGKTKMLALHDIHFGDWYMLAQSAGTTLFDEQGNYQGDNEKSVAAMQFLHDMVYKEQIAGIAPADAQNDWAGPAYWAAWKADQYATVFGPPWHLGAFIINVPEHKGKWGVQQLPTGLGDGKPTANFGGTGMAITEQSKNVDLAWDLIKAVNLTKEGVLTDFKLRTAYPAYKPAYEDPALNAPSEYYGGIKIGEIYKAIAPELTPFRQSPVRPEATEAFVRIVITPVMQDKKDAKTALTELRAEIDRLKNV